MKISLNFKHILICFAAIATSTFQSCDDKESYDVVGNPANIVYINYNLSTDAPQYNFRVLHTPIGSISNEIAKIPVRSMRPMGVNASVKAELDNSLIEAYNKKYGTTCVALPEGVIDLSKATATIPEGNYLGGDSVTISLDKSKLELLTEKVYLAPVKLTSISDPGSQASIKYSTAYIVVNTSKTIIKDNVASTAMLGSLVTNYSTWSATASPASTSSTFDKMFDGNTTTYWQFGTSPVSIVVDMKELKKVTGFKLFAQYASTGPSYLFSKVQVSLSNDNIAFEDVGTSTSSTMVNESGYQYISFYGATETRYVKLTLHWTSTYRRICELGVYTN